MKIKLPRTMQMRIMLAIAVLQMLVVGLFSIYWIVQEVGEELTSRQSIAHKILSLTVPSVERALYQETPDELGRYLQRVVADPLIGGIVIKDASGKMVFNQMKPLEPIHLVVRQKA